MALTAQQRTTVAAAARAIFGYKLPGTGELRSGEYLLMRQLRGETLLHRHGRDTPMPDEYNITKIRHAENKVGENELSADFERKKRISEASKKLFKKK